MRLEICPLHLTPTGRLDQIDYIGLKLGKDRLSMSLQIKLYNNCAQCHNQFPVVNVLVTVMSNNMMTQYY